jgi:hypothetical protein
MNHRVWVLVALLFGVPGCLEPQTRLQAPDEPEHEKDYGIQTIGDVTSVANAEPIAVSGVGVVIGLDGTGGDAPPGSYRQFLEDDLRKRGVQHVKEILASPNNSMVLVSALIPPGAHKNDPLDVEVTLPAQSKTTSLRGGYLKECILFNYDSKKNLDPNYGGSNQLLRGHTLAVAEGPVMLGTGEGEDAKDPRHGRVWGGGRCRIDRVFYMVMDNDHQSVPVVQRAIERINETFHGPYRGSLSDVAVAQRSKSYFCLCVPQQYRLNVPRYLRVVRLIPLQEAPVAGSPYRKRLEEELLNPAHTVTAALRLEALGNSSLAALQNGLRSEHPLVRFAAAEALAYLGNSACGEELTKMVERQPLLRAFSLTAMASLDEPISHVKLRELMASPAAEARYGAFRALRALDEHDSAVQGELINDSFWLHRAAPGSASLVHFSTSRRAEVVIFGEDPRLTPPFAFRAGEFTITAARHDDRCTLSRSSVRNGLDRRQCSLRVEEVIRNLADMGATYPEVAEFLRQAGDYRCLNCPVAIDALPQATSVYELVKGGGAQPEILKTDAESLRAQEAFGATPTLYEKTSTGLNSGFAIH